MTNHSTISESAIRARFERRRHTPPASSTAADLPRTAATPAPADASSPPAGSRLLRRWSVAELVARAAARPSSREPVRC
jgi:hypothetical protein